MRLLRCFLILAALAVVAMADSNVTGKWLGSFKMTNPNGETQEGTAVLVLTQNGTAITGTVGPAGEEPAAIQKGKIEGDKISLEAAHDGATITFDLVVASDRITGDAKVSHEGQISTAKIDVSRAK